MKTTKSSLGKTKLNKSSENILDLTDEALFELSLKNPSFFEVIVNRYKQAFLRKAAPIVSPIGGINTVEDVVQEAFVKMYVKGESFTSRGKGSFRSWAYAILMNTCFSAYRKAKRDKLVSIDENLEIYATIPDMNLAEEEEKKLSLDFVLSLLSGLPDTLRRTAELYFIKGKNHQEIAMAENANEGTIRTRVHRAKVAIKKLKDENFKYNLD